MLKNGPWKSFRLDQPPMHQNSKSQLLTDAVIRGIKTLRSPRKVSDAAGLYLLVAPTGGRYWRYNYRFNGKQKTLALGIYPDVLLAKARARHQEARGLLAVGIDPSTYKRALRSRSASINSDARVTKPAAGIGAQVGSLP